MRLDESVRAALLRHPGAVVAGTTAAILHGAVDVDLLDRDGPVELVVTSGARPAPGLLLRRDRLEADEIVDIDGVRLTTPRRTAFDVGRRLGTVDAVVVLEALGRGHGVTTADVRGIVEEHPHERGLARLRTALEHVEPEARAGIETPVRMAGLLPALGWSVELVDRERFATGRDLVIEGAQHLIRRRRREQRRPEDVEAAITASWPSRARRRTVTARLYS